ncbi:MAG: transcription antitermination factor NusB [Kordiimonadaceae bacterium]|nr:transcription antitermination factor NusB [Kordiimonadaceae bacterium]MBT7581779.1 transcription antitermination factor NusB [Kordiimonadaceae bacterium]
MTDNKAAKGGARSAARLAAVQALYQIEASGSVALIVVQEFVDHRFGEIIDDSQYSNADSEFFSDIVLGVDKWATKIDDYIKSSLSKDWNLERIESVARAVLRAGTYEIIARPDVPTSVIINEYIDVAKAFSEDNTPGFVNGVLDKIAGKIRSDKKD